MISRVMLVAAALMLKATVLPEPQYFRYERPITLATPSSADSAAPAQACVVMDTISILHASRGLADVRIYQDDTEVPYAYRNREMGIDHSWASVEPLNRSMRDGNVVFDAEMRDVWYQTLELEIDKKDFVATVRLFGGNTIDSSASAEIGTYTIFDLETEKGIRNTTIQLPMTTYRFLHFEIIGLIDPAVIQELRVSRVQSLQPVFTPVASITSLENKGQRTVGTVTLSSKIPVEWVQVTLADSTLLFVRSMSAQAVDDNGRRLERGRDRIYRVSDARNGVMVNDEQLGIDVPWETSDDEFEGVVTWEVEIDNEDNAPLPITSIDLMMRERTLCFDAVAGASYRMLYGDTALAVPSYDYATLFKPAAKPIIGTLGAEGINPGYVIRPDTRPWTEKFPAVLWGVLVLMVVGLAGIAVRTARRMSNTDE